MNSIDRRKFLKATGALIAGASIEKDPISRVLSAGGEQPSPTGRLVLPINQNWRYNDHLVDGFEKQDFDDSEFAAVCLPLALSDVGQLGPPGCRLTMLSEKLADAVVQ